MEPEKRRISRLACNRVLDAYVHHGAGTPEDKASVLCELIRKINVKAKGEAWCSPLPKTLVEALSEIERRLFFAACRDLRVALGCMDEILACFEEVWLPKGLTSHMVQDTRRAIERFFNGVRYEKV